MNIVNAGYKIIPEFKGDLAFTKKIESIARVCYKSEDLITEDSCIRMVNSLIKNRHYAMLEHSSLVLEVDINSFNDTLSLISNLQTGIYKKKKFLNFKSYLRFTKNLINDEKNRCIISGNIRAWIEFLQTCLESVGYIPNFVKCYFQTQENNYSQTDTNILFKDFLNAPSNYYMIMSEVDKCGVKRISDFSELSVEERFIHQDLSVKFTSDLLIQRELVRHRDASFAGESTRYCNYSKDKFGNEITVIKSCFLEEDSEVYGEWKSGCEEAEKYYFSLLNEGLTAERARDELPVATKCDTVVTANIREWIHILELRALGTTGKPHPKMLEIMVPLAKELTTGLLSDFTCIDSVNKMFSL